MFHHHHHHHSVFCLTTVSKPPPKRFLHIMRSIASSFKWEYLLLSLRPSCNVLRLLLRLLVTSISTFIFPSITCFRRQFLRKMWPIKLAFRFLISCRIFLCSLFHCPEIPWWSSSVLPDNCIEKYLKNKLYIIIRQFDACLVLFLRHTVKQNLSYVSR